MKLSFTDITKLCKIAENTAEKAGLLIDEYSKKKFRIMSKEDAPGYASQVLTEVDLQSQELILKELKASMDCYDLAFLGEESTDDKSRLTKDYFWCVDPIDGTLPFIEGKSGYAVSIALINQRGESIFGVVYDPVEKNLYSAISGAGAFKNHQKWTPLQQNTNTFLWCMDRSFKNYSDFLLIKDKLENHFRKKGLTVNIRDFGGAVMNAIWCLENSKGCYFKFPKKEAGGGSIWDFAATACIYKEVGAIACDFQLSPLDLNRKDSTYMNHKGALFATDAVSSKVISCLLQ